MQKSTVLLPTHNHPSTDILSNETTVGKQLPQTPTSWVGSPQSPDTWVQDVNASAVIGVFVCFMFLMVVFHLVLRWTERKRIDKKIDI